MFGLINNDDDSNDIGTEEGTQAEAYDIDVQPLFDMTSANCTTFYVNGQGEDESEEEEDTESDPDADVSEDVVVDATAQAPPPWPRRRRYQREPQAIHPRRMFAFAGLGLQLAKTPFPGLSKRARPIGGG
jgi:hypothetical protein